jgi:peptidoglycan hydrolase CwlO-like protein
MGTLDMSDIVAVGSVVAVVLTAFFAGVVSIITAIRTTAKSTTDAVQEVKTTAETVKTTTETVKAATAALVKKSAEATNELHSRLDSQDSALTEITSLTNGAASEQRARIERLEALVREMVQAKADQEVAAEHARKNVT